MTLKPIRVIGILLLAAVVGCAKEAAAHKATGARAGPATTNPFIKSTSIDLSRADLLNARVFGAAGDGKPLDSPAINKAIEAAAAKGGGMVFFPAGDYLSMSIRLKSNVSLYLDQGATIVAADPKDGHRYDPPEPNEIGPVPGLRPHALAELADLGRESGEHLDPRPRQDLGQRPRPQRPGRVAPATTQPTNATPTKDGRKPGQVHATPTPATPSKPAGATRRSR